MPPQSAESRKIIREADKIEKRLERAYIRAMENVRAKISINELGIAIGNGSLRNSMKTLPMSDIEDALSPFQKIIEDTGVKGGALGVSQIVDMLKRG